MALLWGVPPERLGGLVLMRKSALASKNFCEFVGTFAGHRKTLVGGSPSPRHRLRFAPHPEPHPFRPL